MRIACIAQSQIPSTRANSIRVMKMCAAFMDAGHEVHLWLPGESPRISGEEIQLQYGIKEVFPVTWIKNKSWLRGYDFGLQALMAARRWQADFFYTWPYQAAAFSSLFGFPTGMEVHDFPPSSSGTRLFKLFLAGKGLRRVLPITQALSKDLQQRFTFPADESMLDILPLGVDLDQYLNLPDSVGARQELNFPDAITVGYTGHLYAGRGIELLFDLAGRNPQVQFLWAGGEPETISFWEGRIRTAGMDNIRLLGFKPHHEMPLIQAACDILAMPYAHKISTSSGGDTARYASPIKAFEYLASGRVILSSDLPVLHEILTEENAILLSPEDVDAWDRALKMIIQDDSMRTALGASARKTAQQYSWNARARKALRGLES